MIPEAAALTTDQRRWVEQAGERLGSHLVPASAADVGRSVAVLQAQFPAREIDEGTAAARAEGYLMALDGVPLFAIREAVKRFMQSDAGLNPSYMPKAPELRALVDRLSLPARAHRVHLRRLLEAEVERTPTPEERARVRDLVENLKASLAAPVEDIRKGQ
jgi:ribosomal protein L17